MPMDIAKNIVNKSIDELIFAEYNPRQLSKDQFKYLKDSIDRFGLVDPIIINKNKDRKNIIIGGHQRIKVAKSMGIKEVPCLELDLNYDKERELNVRLNKNTGEWDFDVLANNFDIEELHDWGFDDSELKLDLFEEEIDGLIDDDEIPEAVEPICKLGDVWQLGKHRLVCGDATNENNLKLLMDKEKVDMIFTDPPYSSGGYQESGKTSGSIGARGQKKIATDNLSTRGYLSLMNSVLSSCTSSHSVFIFCDWKMWGYNLDIAESKGYRVRNMLVWDKMQMGMGMPFRNQHELCLFGSKIAGKIGNGKTPNVLQHKRDRKAQHVTPKPVGLIIDMINQIDSINIYDPFLGGGSTLIACEKTNRVCYGMELDEHYCDVIINRWEKFTGQKAEKVNG